MPFTMRRTIDAANDQNGAGCNNGRTTMLDHLPVLKVAVIPDPVKYARNLYLHFLYRGIGSINITSAGSVASSSQNKPDILHMHFPDHVLSVPVGVRMVWRMFSLFSILSLACLRGIRIAWTVHNIQPHHPQPAWLCDFFYRSLSGFVDGLVFHSDAMRSECLRIYPWLSDRRSAIVRHPSYPAFSLGPDDKSPVTSLGIRDSRCLVCIAGAIRSNKNIIRALRDFIQLDNLDWTLVIAGECMDASLDNAIRGMITGRENVHYISRFLSEGEFDEMLRASDIVAIPYGALHTSGVAIRALSLRRKVLALYSPEMREIQSIAPRMVRIVDTIDQLWLALPRSREPAWDGLASVGLPDEFSPEHCQEELARFYHILVE